MTEEQKEAAARAAKTAGVTLRSLRRRSEEEAKKFGTADVDYIFDQPPERIPPSDAEVCDHPDLSCVAGVGGGGTRSAHDRN